MSAQAKLTAVLTANTAGFHKGMDGAIAKGRNLSNEIAKGFLKGEIIKEGAEKILEFGKMIGESELKVFELGKTLTNVAARLGDTAGNAMILRQAMKEAGIDAESAGVMMNRMQKTLANIDPTTAQQMGIDLKKLDGLAPTKQMEELGKQINAIKDPTDRANAAIMMFGKGGGALLSLFADGGAFETAGHVLGRQTEIMNQDAEKFKFITNALENVGVTFQGFFVGVADRIVDTILPVFQAIEGADLVGLGQRFGDALLSAASVFLGVFADPAAAMDAFSAYLSLAFTGAAKVLVSILTAGVKFVFNGALPLLKSIGDFLLGTLLETIQDPIVSFQAGIMTAFTSAGPLLELAALQLKKGLVECADSFKLGMLDGAARVLGVLSKIPGLEKLSDFQDNVIAQFDATAEEAKKHSDYNKGEGEKKKNELMSGIGKDYEANKQFIKDNGGASIATGDGTFNAEGLKDQASKNMKEAWGGLTSVIGDEVEKWKNDPEMKAAWEKAGEATKKAKEAGEKAFGKLITHEIPKTIADPEATAHGKIKPLEGPKKPKGIVMGTLGYHSQQQGLGNAQMEKAKKANEKAMKDHQKDVAHNTGAAAKALENLERLFDRAWGATT